MTIPQPILKWIESEPAICSAVHFGSGAISQSQTADEWSDVDLHLVTRDVGKLLHADWSTALPDLGYCFHATREATGGVKKLTVIFAKGQMDLILVPRSQMYLAKWGLAIGMPKWHRRLRIALDEIHTCLRSGYQFLKGEGQWGGFYHRVATEMKGVRLTDTAVREIAEVAALDILWVWQKIARGEFCAAQHVLHRSVAETNFRLLRELRLRRGEPLPSFGLGRRVETLLPETELAWVSLETRLDAAALRAATVKAANGMQALMRELLPPWRFPQLPDETWQQANSSN